MTLDDIWHALLAGTGITKTRSDFRYDPEVQKTQNSGSQLGRKRWFSLKMVDRTLGPRNSWQTYAGVVPELKDLLRELVIEPTLKAALEEGSEEAFELAFELISLGDPVDRQVSNFSHSHYYRCYPDVGHVGINGFHHYIQYGHREGRRTLQALRQNQFAGAQVFTPDKPTCIIGVHEYSRTGAPIVGLEMAQSAAKTHNVIVVGLRGGALVPAFQNVATAVLISEDLDSELEYFGLQGMDNVELALLNSVECVPFTKFLVGAEIPFASYIHEFSDYTHPAYKLMFVALFSDLLVFSSNSVRDSWQPTFTDLDFDVARDSIIVPQAELSVGNVDDAAYSAARAHLSRLIGVDCAGRRIVYGAGYMDWRKGTDLFVLTAQIARKTDPDTIFVWIGDGQNHEDHHFGIWFDKHLRAAGANTPEGNLFVLPAGPHYQDICRAADVLFLPSRLDPLPNVMFDATKAGCHAVLFSGATGFDDSLYAEKDMLKRVGYGDLNAAWETIRTSPLKRPRASDTDLPDVAQSSPDIFSRISTALRDQLARRCNFVIGGGGEHDVTILFPAHTQDHSKRVREREKIWSYGRRFVWRSVDEARHELAASDNWIHQKSRIGTFSRTDWPDPGQMLEFSVHIHVYYTENLTTDLARYELLRRASRLVITTDTDNKAAQITHYLRSSNLSAEVIVVANQGRDILPFLRLFSDYTAATDADEIWCHVHQKQSVGTMASGDIWHRYLMDILLGDEDGISSALAEIARPGCGLVAAFDPYIVDWNASRRLLPAFEGKLPGPLPEHNTAFPVGNMFWTRAGVVVEMNRLFGRDYPWPNEPIANDGTVYHLIERLWPAACATIGLDAIFLEKHDQRRT